MCAITKGTPIRLCLEDRTNTLEPKQAKMCPSEMGICTRHSFCINIHQSDVASTIANKDINNTLNQKCAFEHMAIQSGSRAWKLCMHMQMLPWLTLQMIKHEEPNAANPGLRWGTETYYKGLFVVRQQFTKHKEDGIPSIQEIVDDVN